MSVTPLILASPAFTPPRLLISSFLSCSSSQLVIIIGWIAHELLMNLRNIYQHSNIYNHRLVTFTLRLGELITPNSVHTSDRQAFINAQIIAQIIECLFLLSCERAIQFIYYATEYCSCQDESHTFSYNLSFFLQLGFFLLASTSQSLLF
jgi:hypothetical protein